MTKKRILILGGGCGGVSTAWSLSRTPELRDRFEVTVVQSGHRLGGKGATGRDPARAHAVLEHGLHLWLGFYESAFAMMRDVYEAWDGPEDGPQRSIEAAFSPLNDVVLVGGDDDLGDLWRMRFPPLPGRPWDAPPPLAQTVLASAATWAANVLDAMQGEHGRAFHPRRVLALGLLSAAIARGLASEYARHGEALFEAMNDEDLRAWLTRWGASAAVADLPPIRALYDLGFAYPDGIAGPGKGAMAAGAGIKVLLRIFGGYRGAPFYRMNAGMGDAVFAPAYEVLRARGVRFRLFHDARALRVQGDAVCAVELGVQAEGWEVYDPLVRLGDLRCWPERPRAEQLRAIASGRLDDDDPRYLSMTRLEAGRDFDDVVLAIPASAHPRIASELIERSERYRTMVESTTAVPTLALQVWLGRSAAQLGFGGPPPVLTGLPGPFRTWADLSEVIESEGWQRRPSALAYFCGVAPPACFDVYDRDQTAASLEGAVRGLLDGPLLSLWPRARDESGRLDPRVLHAEPELEARASLYARANVARWERYVLSLPGSIRKRLRPDESGFANLYLAGDWTRNAIDGGSVEGAVSSGVAAARAIADARRS